MKTWLLASSLLAAGLTGVVAYSATQPSTLDAHAPRASVHIDEAEAVARARLDDGTLNGGVAILRSGSSPRLLFSGRTTYPDGSEINESTRFRIASLTKVITRIAVLRLVDEGRVSLDNTLAQHRPGLHADWAHRITLRQLLSFRSGLPRERAGAANPIDAGVTLDENGRGLGFLDGLVEDGPTIEPGSRVLYSNLGYFHLGGVIESITGEPAEDALRDLVFMPTGMTSTSLGDHDSEDQENLAMGHRSHEDGSLVRGPAFPIEPRYLAGGLVSTLGDLMALSDALLDGRLLSDESFELLMSEFGTDDDRAFRVAGLVPGFANVWSISAEPPTAVVLLNNAVGSNPSAIVSAHDEIAALLRNSEDKNPILKKSREEDGWNRLRRDSDWPEHALMDSARVFFAECMRGDADQLYEASLAVRGKVDSAIDEDSRDAFRWMAGYQAALRDRYGPFELAWWRHGENGAFEFLFEGPEGRALRIKLRPSDADPTVSSTMSIATVGFDADSSLYEGFSDD